MKQLAALLAAAALVVGAIALRRAWSADDDTRRKPPELHSVICDTAIEAACKRLEHLSVTVERAGVTAERVGAGKPLGAEAWIVAAPWVAVAGFGPAQPRLVASRPIATTEVSAVVRKGGGGAAACKDWGCFAKPGWRLAHDSVDTTSGLAGIGALVSGHLGGVDFSSDQFDPDFDQWLDAVEHSANLASPGAPVIPQLSTSGGFDVALGLRPTTIGLAGSVSAVTPKDSPTIDIVVAGNQSVVDRDTLVAALRRAGWRRGAGGSPMDPGSLAALRQRVKEVAR